MNKMSRRESNVETDRSKANKGKAFEKYIDAANSRYRDLGLIDVYQQHPEVKVRRGRGGFDGARFHRKSGLDFIGVYKGLAITFDAKESKQSSFPMANIADHQIATMRRFQKHGGFAFLLVNLTKYREVFLISASDVLELLDDGKRSITHQYFVEHGVLVRPGRNVTVDYLSALECVINENFK